MDQKSGDIFSNTTRNESAIVKALSFVRAIIDKEKNRAPVRLAPYRTLATLCAVSAATMWRALQQLCNEKALLACGRKGFYIGFYPSTNTQSINKDVSSATYQKPAERLVTALKRDFYDGVYEYNQKLPPFKILAARYRTTFTTLKKALEELYNSGILQLEGKSYRFSIVTSRRCLSSFFLLTSVDSFGSLFLHHPRGEEFCRALSRESIRRGIRFDTVGYKFLDGKFVTEPDLLRKSSLGFIVLRLYNDASAHTLEFYRFIESLSSESRPVAVIDDGATIPKQIRMRKTVRLFSVGFMSEIGRQVGQYLLAMGHRRIAYISAYHKTIWSQNRYIGLCEAFNTFGKRASVSLYADPSGVNIWNMGKLSPDTTIYPGRPHDVYRRLEELKSNCPKQLQSVANKTILHFMIHENQLREKACLWRLFEAAASEDQRITAWICANDNQAVFALDFLKTAGIAVPDKISVLGFDDSSLAFEHELTSVNVSIDIAAYRALNFICAPAAYCRSFVDQIEYVPALVVQRSSIRRINVDEKSEKI